MAMVACTPRSIIEKQINQIPRKLTVSEPLGEDTATLIKIGIYLEHLSVLPSQDPALQFFPPLAWIHKDTDSLKTMGEAKGEEKNSKE